MGIFGAGYDYSKAYFWGLVFTVLSLPISKFALSLSMIWLLANWVFEGQYRKKMRSLAKNYPVLVFLALFFVHVFWLVNTENFRYAFHDLGNKAILLLYPVIISTSAPLSPNKLKIVFNSFALSVVLSTLISTFILTGAIQREIDDIRQISAFMSHIRLSLLINLCIFILCYLVLSKNNQKSMAEMIVYIVAVVWLAVFLFLLKSFTGIIIFFILFFPLAVIYSFKIQHLILRVFVRVMLLTIFLLIFSFVTHSVSKYYTRELVDFENLQTHTPSGNKYEHLINETQIENGNYVWIYICWPEMEKEWGKRSLMPFRGKDHKGQSLQNTLVRYLTSKGFRKDSAGVSKLTNQDIRNIEGGMANYIFSDQLAMYPKIYQLLWQADVYKKGYNPAGNSVTQRIGFLKAGWYIAMDQFWFGVGTGDVQDSFNIHYDKSNVQLPVHLRLRAHNQWLTFLLTFGIVGFCIVVFSLIFPIIRLKGYKNYFFMVFIVIALLSFLSEDTLETQIGASFFSFFYALFLFGNISTFKNKDSYGP